MDTIANGDNYSSKDHKVNGTSENKRAEPMDNFTNFLTLCAYYIALLLIKMKSEIFIKLQNRKLKKYFPKVLRELSTAEIKILLCFYEENEKDLGWKQNLIFKMLQ